MPRRQREVAHEGAAAGFAADQPHLFQFTIDARGGGQRDARSPAAVRCVGSRLPAGSCPLRIACAYRSTTALYRAFIVKCIYDNNLIVLDGHITIAADDAQAGAAQSDNARLTW